MKQIICQWISINNALEYGYIVNIVTTPFFVEDNIFGKKGERLKKDMLASISQQGYTINILPIN